jgi:hypothetical protein
VDVDLAVGDTRYCLRFGGVTTFEPERKLRADDAPAPEVCVE